MEIKTITSLTNTLTGSKITDAQSGFRAYSKKVLNEITPTESGMGISTEILIKSAKNEMRITEVPITISYEGNTHSQEAVSHGTSVVMSTIKHVAIERPLLYYGVTGLCFTILGLIFGGWTIQIFSDERVLAPGFALIGIGGVILGTILLITATILYSISINVIKKYLYDLDASSITAIAFLMIGPFAGIHLFTTDFITILTSHDDSIKALGYITLLSVLGTAIAVIIFNKLINNSTAIFASSVTYLIPVIAIIWGVFDGEQLTAYHIICVVIILIGVYLVNTKTSTDTSVL